VISLGVIAAVLGTSVVASLVWPRPSKTEPPVIAPPDPPGLESDAVRQGAAFARAASTACTRSTVSRHAREL